MKRKLLWASICLFLAPASFGQNAENEFKIGYWLLGKRQDVNGDPSDGDEVKFKVGTLDPSKSCKEFITSTTFDDNGTMAPIPSSPLNQLCEDGVNVVANYYNYWIRDKKQKSFIELVESNSLEAEANNTNYDGLKFHSSAPGGYIPNYNPTYEQYYSTKVPDGTGKIVFSNNYSSNNGSVVFNHSQCQNAYLNDQTMLNPTEVFTNIYDNSTSKKYVWGLQLAEEAHFYHHKNWDIKPGTANGEFVKEYAGEVPPNYWHEWYDELGLAQDGSSIGTDFRQVIFFASHNKAINQHLDDVQNPNVGATPYGLTMLDSRGTLQNAVWTGGPGTLQKKIKDHDPYEYLIKPGGWDNRFSVFEGSYTPADGGKGKGTRGFTDYNTMFTAPGGGHQLGIFESIEYSKQYTPDVHKMIYTYLKDKILLPVDDPDYTVEGGYPYPYYYFSSEAGPNKFNGNWLWFQAYNSIIHGAHGVWLYGLGYRNDEVGDVNANGNKQGNFHADISGHPEALDFSLDAFPWLYKNYSRHLIRELAYLQQSDLLSTAEESIVLTKIDAGPTDWDDPNCITPNAQTYLPTDFLDARYALRYTIRTDGEDAIMIISNPTPERLNNISLDMRGVEHPAIQNPASVERLFNNQSVQTTGYKVDRNSNIDLVNQIVGVTEPLTYVGKFIEIDFDPYDVHIIRFTKSGDQDGWDKQWTNEGNGKIDDWTIEEDDKFYFGDFDGDGLDEIMACKTDPSNTLMSLYEFDNTIEKWSQLWTNDGDPNSAIAAYRDNFIVGDFDGDGDDDLLGNGSNGWITMFRYISNGSGGMDWSWWFSTGNCSQGTSPILSYSDVLYTIDRNGDGTDEVFGADLTSNTSAMLSFDPNCACAGCWSVEYANPSTHGIASYLGAQGIVGDFTSDAGEEIMFFDAWATIFDFSSTSTSWSWSTSGATQIDGWNYPFSSNEAIVTGEFDNNGDGKDELMFLERGVSANKAGTFDLNWYNNPGRLELDWNWPSNTSIPAEKISDWSLSAEASSETQYYSATIESGEPDYLIAIRNPSCAGAPSVMSMFKTNGNVPNYKKEPTSIKEPNNHHELSIYPNPSTGMFRVEGVNLDDVSSVSVYDASGKSVYASNAMTTSFLDLKHLPAGVYNLQVVGDHFSTQSRIVIQK